MAPGLLLVLSAALALQPPEMSDEAKELRKAELIEQIEGAAAAEPPVFGIDTRILAADILKGHDDVHAARFLRDAGQRTLLLADAPTRAHFLRRIVDLLTPLDAAHAESLCGSQSRRLAGERTDPLAVCYDRLIGALTNWEESREAFDRALAAGAYNMSSSEQLLKLARESHSSDFAPLLAAFVNAFPEQPEADEIARLEAVANAWRRAEPALIRPAIARCRAARAALARRTAAADQGADPKNALKEPPPPLAAPTAEDLEQPKLGFDFNFNFDFGLGTDAEDPQLRGLPETSNLPLDKALGLARSQTYAGARAKMLADMLDNRGAEFDTPRWASVAEETLRESGHMRNSGDLLLIQAELGIMALQRGLKPLAASATQALMASFDAYVQCGPDSCAVFRKGGSPGELLALYVGLLRENSIAMEDLGLQHPDLQARWLLYELEALYKPKPAQKDNADKKEGKSS